MLSIANKMALTIAKTWLINDQLKDTDSQSRAQMMGCRLSPGMLKHAINNNTDNVPIVHGGLNVRIGHTDASDLEN